MKKNEIPLEKFEILNLLHHLLHIKNGQLSYSVSLIMESLQPGGQLKTLIKKALLFIYVHISSLLVLIGSEIKGARGNAL